MLIKFSLFFLFLLGAPVIFALPFLYGYSFLGALGIGLATAMLYLLSGELLFRIIYQLKCGRQPERYERIPFDNVHMEPHPYLPYVYKKGFPHVPTGRSREATFSLHKGTFKNPRVGFNNLGLINGPDGKLDVVVPKPEGRYRVLCLGDSTTLTSVEKDGRPYSYPMILEKELRKRHPGRDIEVLNGGMGGWSSAETLVNFMLNLVDTDPDLVIFYGGYNDLVPSLTPGFQADYSHCKQNLSAHYDRFRIRGAMPDLPSSMYHYLLNLLVPGNLTYTVLQLTAVGDANLAGDFQGTDTFKRNVKHLIDICKGRNIEVICSTYCQYLYDKVQDSPQHLKFKEGLAIYNNALMDLARTEGVGAVDAASRMPDNEKYYLDSIHLTPDGMTKLTEMLAEEVDAALNRKH